MPFQDFDVIASLVPMRHDPDVGSSGFGFRGIGERVSASADITRDKHGDGWRQLPSGDYIQNDRLGTLLLKAVGVVPPPPPPQPIDAVVSAWSAWAVGTWSECFNGKQHRTETRTRSIIVPAQNGGSTPALSEVRVTDQVCGGPPPVPSDTTRIAIYSDSNFHSPIIGYMQIDDPRIAQLRVGPDVNQPGEIWVKINTSPIPEYIGGWLGFVLIHRGIG